MQTENQYLIDELNEVRKQISTLFPMLSEDCQCFEALQKIQMMEGSLNSVTIKIIQHQLIESIALIKETPSSKECQKELKRLTVLFSITNPVYYQLTMNKVEYE